MSIGRPAAGSPDRKEQQRARIVAAAERCAVEKGLHAATIANIAATAKMSPGLIYRYFANKNEIILAIIERQLAEQLAHMTSLKSGRDLHRQIVELFANWQRGDPSVMSAALFLEISAEATRDPEIAKAVVDADRIGDRTFQRWLREKMDQTGPAFDESIRSQAMILHCFIEGLAARAVREPDLSVDEVSRTFRRLLKMLLPPEDCSTQVTVDEPPTDCRSGPQDQT